MKLKPEILNLHKSGDGFDLALVFYDGGPVIYGVPHINKVLLISSEKSFVEYGFVGGGLSMPGSAIDFGEGLRVDIAVDDEDHTSIVDGLYRLEVSASFYSPSESDEPVIGLVDAVFDLEIKDGLSEFVVKKD